MEDDYGQFTYLDYQQEARPRKNIEYVEIEGLQTSISIESLDDWFENTNSNIDEISKKINDLTKQKMFIFTRLCLIIWFNFIFWCLGVIRNFYSLEFIKLNNKLSGL